ncbi:MAG: DUF255 domain-containing protein [Calditrichaeota bacterium]|nr:MAG: DUF255 domain-containing protein [Calditrichota bacterium]
MQIRIDIIDKNCYMHIREKITKFTGAKMKKFSFATATILVALSASMVLGAGGQKKEKKGIVWLNFPQAIAKAKKENKMIVVDFYTDWCTWCKVMDEKTYGANEIIDFARKKLIMAKVNAESKDKVKFKENEYTYEQLAQAFGVTGYPSTIFLGPNGEFLTSVSGYIPPDHFLPILEFLEGKHYQKMKFEEYLKKRKAGAKS